MKTMHCEGFLECDSEDVWDPRGERNFSKTVPLYQCHVFRFHVTVRFRIACKDLSENLMEMKIL